MTTTKLQDGIQLYAASMGKIFRVTHVLPDMDAANKAMAQDRNIALIAEDNNGLCYLAEQYGVVCPSAILDDVRRHSRMGRPDPAQETEERRISHTS